MEIYSGGIIDVGFENNRAGREGAFEYVWDLRVNIRDNGLPGKGKRNTIADGRESGCAK